MISHYFRLKTFRRRWNATGYDFLTLEIVMFREAILEITRTLHVLCEAEDTKKKVECYKL